LTPSLSNCAASPKILSVKKSLIPYCCTPPSVHLRVCSLFSDVVSSSVPDRFKVIKIRKRQPVLSYFVFKFLNFSIRLVNSRLLPSRAIQPYLNRPCSGYTEPENWMLVNNELQRTWNTCCQCRVTIPVSAWTAFNKTTKNLTRNSQYPGLYTNSTPPKHKSKPSQLQPPSSICSLHGDS
jgi:hypothetical protein